jgi:biopolymer transport protein TolR
MDICKTRGGDRAPISQINVKPLVDAMLVLLIIFMVTASVGQQGITVSLPRAKAEALALKEEIVTVAIGPSLQVFINSKCVAAAELKGSLERLYANGRNRGRDSDRGGSDAPSGSRSGSRA